MGKGITAQRYSHRYSHRYSQRYCQRYSQRYSQGYSQRYSVGRERAWVQATLGLGGVESTANCVCGMIKQEGKATQTKPKYQLVKKTKQTKQNKTKRFSGALSFHFVDRLAMAMSEALKICTWHILYELVLLMA